MALTDAEGAEIMRNQAINFAVDQLDDLELDVRRALDTGQLNGLPLTSAQLVAMVQERRRIITERCWLLDLYPRQRGQDND